MRFIERAVSLGGDRVSSARVEENGDAGFIIASGDALVYKKIPAGSKQPVFTGEKTISYSDDCFRLEKGTLHKRGGFTYVPD